MAMERSPGVGFLAVFAVSGSVALISGLVHKRLLSDFMKKIELEFSRSGKLCQVKKRVRFADEVNEWLEDSDLMMRRSTKPSAKAAFMEDDDDNNSMPLNRQVLYKQILEYKALRRP